MAENKLLSLYNTLSTDPDLTEAGDNNFGSYDDFKEVMQDPHNIESVYNFVSKKGGYGTLDEFSASLQDTGDEVQTPDYDKGQQVKGDATVVSPDEPYAAYGGADEEPGYPQADYSKLNNTELAKRAEQSLTDMDSAVDHNDEEGYKSSLGDYIDVKSEMDLRKDDPIYLDLSSATDAQLQQLSSDDTLNDIESRTDPNEKRAYLNQHLAAKSEVKKRADAARHAANVGDVADVNAAADVARRREATRDPGGVDKERRANVNRALNSYERLWRKYDDGSGKTTSSAEQGISKHYQRYNDNIRKARKMSDGQLWDNFETVMNTTYREGDTLKAVDAIPLMEEIVSREKGGGHAETIGERNAREFLYGVGGAGGNGAWRRYGDNSDVRNMEGSVAWHYDQFLQGGADHVSDFNRDFDSTYRDVPIFAIAGKAVSLIDERLNAVAERYNNRWAIHSPGESVDLSEYRDAVKSMNITDAIKTAMSGYDKNKLLGYIAAFAEKNDLSIDEATARVNELIFEQVMERESEAIAPKNEFDYWMRTVLTENFAAQMVKGAVALSAYRPGEVGAYHVEERAKADYLRTHADGFVNNAVTVSAELAKFVLDGYGGAFKLPGLFAKGAPLLLGGMTTAGTRALMRDGVKRYASGALGGALNFMAFQTEMESLRQLRLGDYSGMALLDAAVKGLGEGAVFGAVGGAFDRMFLNARGWQVPVGEALKFVGEGGTFATFGYLESGGNLTMKDLASSFGMALIPRMQHFSQWARDVDARFHGKNGYANKVRVHKISKAEQEDLESKGYTYIAMALRGSALTKGDVEHLSRELDAMREDKEVPWEYVRMADWVLNGRIEVLPPVVKYIYEDTGESYSITPQDENGRAINGTFTTRNEAAFITARRAMDVVINQNNMRLAERAALSTSYERAIARAAIASCRPGEDAKAVYNLYRDAQRKVNAGEQLGEIERDIYDSVNAQLKDMTLVDEAAAYKAVLKRAGYDVDSILKKHPDEWTSQERMIIDKYEQWLSDAQINADAANGQDFIAWAKGQTQREAATDGAVPVESREDVTEAERGGVDADAEMQSQLDAKLGDDIAEPHEPVARATEQPEPQPAENREGATTEGVPVRGTESAERVAERGTPAHYDDAVALYPSAKDLGGEDLEDLLYAMEIERNEAHRYANGEIDEKPENYDYWAARDGLVKNEATVEPEESVASPGEPQPAEPQPINEGVGAAENGEHPVETPTAEPTGTEAVPQPAELQERATGENGEIAGATEPIAPTGANGATGTVETSGEVEGLAADDPYNMPMVNKGGGRMSPNYEKATAEQIFEFLINKSDFSVPGMLGIIDGRIKRYDDELKAHDKKEPTQEKVARRKNVKDPVAVFKREHARWERERDKIETQRSKWSAVRGELMSQENMNIRTNGNDARKAAELNEELGEYDSVEDYVMRSLAAMGKAFRWGSKVHGVKGDISNPDKIGSGDRVTHGLGAHLGLLSNPTERKKYFGWIDPKGLYPEEVAERLHANMPERWADQYSTMDILDMMIDFMRRYSRPRDLMEAAAESRQESDPDNYEREAEYRAADEAAESRHFDTVEDMLEYEDAASRSAYDKAKEYDAAERAANEARGDSEADLREADEEQMRADVAARDAALRQGEEQDGGVQFRAGESDARLSGAGHVERVRGWAANTDRALGTRTRVVTYDELPASVRRQVDAMERRGVRTTGYFDPATGETVVIADRVSSEGEAVATVWHENVGHKGMEQMLGNRYGEWLDRVSELARGEHGQLWTDLAQRYSAQYDAGTDAGRRGLASEFIAEAAERRVSEPSLWARVRGMARRFLIENFNVRMTDADLDYMLWKAAKQVRKSNGLALMRERAEEALLKKRAEDEWKEFMTTWHGSGNANGTTGGKEEVLYRDGETRPTFYSNAERAVENIKQNKASAEQWKAMLTNAGGIKAGEDKWMGLSQWLDENKGKSLTKDEVMQFVRDNGVRMEEFRYTEHPKGFDDLKREYDRWQRTEGFDYAQEQLRERFGDDADIAFDDLGGELVISNEEAAAALLGSEQPINSTRLDYTTEGLENKREIAFVVDGIEPYQQGDAIHFGPENEGRAVMWVRFGETTDADGKRVLVIDEIQSNRHQDAREKGYKEDLDKSKEDLLNQRILDIKKKMDEIEDQRKNTNLSKRKHDILQRLEEIDANVPDVSQRGMPRGNMWLRDNRPELWKEKTELRAEHTRLMTVVDNELKALEKQWDSLREELWQVKDELSQSKRIPAAPFEKNWHEVAMKRMLRLAAEEGFDKVAWTTGEQQAARYNIGDKVDDITVEPYQAEAPGEVDGFDVDINIGNARVSMYVTRDGEITSSDGYVGDFTGKRLAEVVGKEMAEKILSSHEYTRLEGEDLRIGGEGMKGFYDQMLPRFMDKYGKKWGVKTGTVELPNVEDAGRRMHSVDVTPEMKESVMQGQPLFREKLAEGGTLKIERVTPPGSRETVSYITGQRMRVPDGEGEWRIEGMPGTYPSREAALDAFRNRTQGSVLWDISRDGERIHILGAGDAFEALRGGGAKQTERLARWQQQREADGREQINALGEHMGITVKYVDDMSDAERAGLSERQQAAKGWFNPDTGEIFINLHNHHRSSDMVATMLHEAVGHKGLRDLFGEDFDTFLDNVWYNVKLPIGDELRRRRDALLAREGNTLNAREAQRLAVEEYMSEFAEEGRFDTEAKATLWQKFKGWLTEKLRKLGFNGVLSDEDLRYVLWKSYQNQLKQGEMIAKAKDVAMRNKLGIGKDDAVVAAESRIQEPQDSEPRGGDSGLRFRASDVGAQSERDVVLSDVPRITDENRDNKDVRVAAMKAIGGNLSKLRQAMSKQRTYDRETVKLVTDFAKQMIDNGLLSGMSDYEAKQVLTKIKNATGKEDITNDVNKLVDLMIKHQLKAGKVTFAGLLDTKPSRVDSRGIVVAAGLDDKGTRILNAVKAGLTLDPVALTDRINDVIDKLDDPSDVVRENAEAEYDGLMIAQRYLDTVKQRESYEAQYKQMLEDAKAQHKNGHITNTDYKQYKQAVEEQIRDNRIGMIEDYGTLAETLGFGIESSKERLKQWRDEQRLRAEEIRHDANRDMQGTDADIHMKPKRGAARVKGTITDSKLPGAIQRVILSPLGTFDTYMRYFGRKFADGAGNLYNRFVRGGIDAQDSEWKAYKADISALDRKARELFGKDAVGLYQLQNSKNKIKVHTKTGDYDLTQLQAAYIYCVNKQADGRMKLRSMGIDESQVQAIADKINPNIIKFFDWVQENFLPGMRERLNETHKRMFGASMDNIVGYFPLRINMLDVPEKETLSAGSRPSTERTQTSVGGIMKRTINNKALDITRVDALQVLLEHIREMEHWNSFAELSRDLNTLLSYKRFKAQVINSTSLRYGNGKNMWEDFVKCAQIVTGNYTPSTGKFNTDVADFTSAWAASNIAFRFWTAMKQFQSGIVGATQANWWYLTKDLTKVLSYGADNTWNWAIANLPTFAERWQSRKMGDTSLDAIDIQRGGKKALSRFVSDAARIGITPNAAIDGLTVAMLGRAIYETRLRKYKRWGYDDATCERRALQDAAISVNETQQSSQGLFKSVLQTDRDVLSRVASMYRNASMGYQRMAVRGIKSVENSLSPKWRAEAYRVTKDMAMRDGLSEPQAERMAKSVVRREFFRGIANMVMFGAIAPITWAGMGKLLPMLFTGQDDDKQVSEEVNKSLVHGISGFVEGLVGGATFGDMAEFLYDLSTDEDAKVSDARLPENDPLLGELRMMKQKASGKPYEAAYDLANLFFSATTGVNPETFVNWYAAISDYYHGDMDTTREALLLAARILNMPESATQKVYVDELMTTSDEAKKLSAEEFAARYARYKRLRGAGYMNLFSSDEADASVEEKYIKKYDTMLQERLGDMDANQLSEIATDGADEKLSRAATKSYYKQSGVEYHAKTSAGGQLYEHSRTAQDIASDVTVKQYDAKLSEVKKAWEAAGGKIGKRGGGYDTYADEDADRVKLDALYKQYRKELKALVNLHIYSEHDKKWMRELGKEKADKSAIMEEKRKERGQLLDALKTLVGDAN